MRALKYYGDGIYQNTIVIGKSYKFTGFSLEHFKEKDGFIQQLAKDLPADVGYNFWNIGKNIDLNMINQMLEKLELIIRDKFKIYANIVGVSFDEDKISKWFNNYKEHIVSLFDDLTAEENYFAYFLPSDILGTANNMRLYPDYQGYFPEYIEYINNELEVQVTNIFKAYKVGLEYGHPPIFPSNVKQDNIDRYFLKYINSLDKKELNDIIIQLFNKFLDDEVDKEMLALKRLGEEKNKEEDDLKKNILKLLTGFINFDTIGENLYSQMEFKPVARGGYFFYPSFSIFLKLADITFLGHYTGSGFNNEFALKKIKDFLKEKLNDGSINYYVIRVYTKKSQDTFTFKDHKYDERYIYLSDKNIPINEDIYRVLKSQEKYANKWDYGLTIGIYGTNKEILDQIYIDINKLLAQEGIKIQLNFHSGYDVFKEYNNRLSLGGPSSKALNVSNFLPLYTIARTLPKTYPVRLESYFGIDVLSGTPIFLNPFKDIDYNKNMIVIGRSGSGKTVFAQQFLQTLTTDKVFAIDPVNTFANLGKYPELGVTVYDMLNIKYNPIGINKDFYKNIGYPLNLVINDKVDLLIDIFNLRKDKENELNRQDFIKIILTYFFEKQDIVKLNNISKFFRDIIKVSSYKELDSDFLSYLDKKNILLNEETFDFYRQKITSLNFKINTIENTIIGRAMNENDKDIIPDLFKERFVVFDISGLKLTDKTIDQISEYDMALFLFLLYSFSLYTNFYKFLFENNSDVYGGDLGQLINNYIVIDEAHIYLNDERLLKKLDKDIRTVRNRRTSIVLLTQSLEDILKMGTEILPNISIKIFFKDEDIKIYKDYLLGKVEEQGNMSEYVENTLMYINFFQDLIRTETKKRRYAFIEYDSDFFINEAKLTGKMKKILGIK